MKNIFSLKKAINSSIEKKKNLHKMSPEEIKEFQNHLLVYYSEIMQVCSKYGIKPFLVGGSLLGYVRDNGFIPWDDDMDLAMNRKDYNRFISIFSRELSDRYILSVPNGGEIEVNRFMQLYRKGTTLRTADMNENQPANICIDIFPVDFAPDNVLLRKLKGYYCNMLMAIAGSVQFVNNKKANKELICNTLNGKVIYCIRMVIGRTFMWKSLNKWFNIVDKSVRGRKRTGKVTIATGRGHYAGEVVDYDAMFPLKKAIFCGVDSYVPNTPDKYLSNLYGSYMEIPEPEKREQHFLIEINYDK